MRFFYDKYLSKSNQRATLLVLLIGRLLATFFGDEANLFDIYACWCAGISDVSAGYQRECRFQTRRKSI